MQLRNTIIALIVLAVIGGFAYLVSRGQKQEQTVKLFKLKPDDIVKVDLKYPNREIELTRNKSGKWEITKPIHADADQNTANNLARAIADCEVKKTVFEKATDLKPFGLDHPAVVVTVTTKNGRTLPGIEVGKTTPVGFSAYIKTTDKPAVILTGSAFPPGMQKTVSDLRDRELMTFNVDDVNKLVIERDTGLTIEVDRAGDKWNIVKPASYPADPTQIRTILSALANSRVADFISDAPTDVTQYGLLKPHLTVIVYTGKQNAEQSLLFGFKQTEQGKDGIYVRRGESAPVYTVHPYVMSDVDKTILDLRDKTVLGVLPADVEKVAISSPAAKFTIDRTKSGWDVVDGGTHNADVPVVERFLSTIRFLKGSAIVADPITNPKDFGLDKPAEEIDLMGKNGKDLGSIKLGKVSEAPQKGQPAPSPEYYVSSSKSTAAYAIDDYTFDQLNKIAAQFQSHAHPTPAASPAK